MENIDLMHKKGPGRKAKCVRNCMHSKKGVWARKHKRSRKACRRRCGVKAA